ncbi:SRPBCC family protein [Algicella marina]|uniref:Vanillate O-demethylase oxidoreductase VanB n=1 Tax=Algicella marina TaxID=2683284 RepID=A0A6P1T2U9_9RHOB|nr:SRPBCC family protein [Algicella marina]QHQ35629.1 vanillate O-demethylase oxidoreductase VanB [Algicella marina]
MLFPTSRDTADAITRSIDLQASPARVWRALTTPEEFGAWFNVTFETGFEVGQEARGTLTEPGYEGLPWIATIIEITPQTVFAMTWHPYEIDEGKDCTEEPQTRVEFRLERLGTGTRLTVTESGFARLPDHRRDEAMRSNAGGWEEQLRRIGAHVGG